MKRMLFNATHSEELRVAIVDGQKLLDLDIETLGKEQRKGNIYTGIITRIEPSLEACFVDYGAERHGFLPFKEIAPSYFSDSNLTQSRIQDALKERLKEGMHLIVQVEKDERGNKGAALTTFISLAGRYLVLMPNNPRGGGVSRRVEGEDRAELKEAMAQLNVPRGMSLIARTAGIGRSAEELQWDFNYLLQLWRAIEDAAMAHPEPYLLFLESSLLIRSIRDYYRPDINEILVDNQEVYEQISEFMSYVMPNNLSKLKLYTDHVPLFSRLLIEQQIETAFSRNVRLPSGGEIVIDHTEALVSIDVNSARATKGADIEETAFKTNLEAAEEVARQMRLRDLGGIVVIDFIDMEDSQHQREVENMLRDALKKDRARVQMGKLSRLGLMEVSRQRLQPALTESSHIACPRCAGIGVIRSIESTALHVLRLIQDTAMKQNTSEVHVQVPVEVATFLLNEKRAELFGLEERLNVSVYLIPNIHLENPHYQIERIRCNDDSEDENIPSYKRVTQPEKTEVIPFADKNGEKAVRPEPAVKGLKHASPAPVAPIKKQSLWGGIKKWFSGLFGGEKQEEIKSVGKNQASKKNLKRNNPNRRQNNKQRFQNENAANTVNKNQQLNQNHTERQNKKNVAQNQRVQNERVHQQATLRQKNSGKNIQAANVNVAQNATKTLPENKNAPKNEYHKNRNNRKQKNMLVVTFNNENKRGKYNNHSQEKRRYIPSAAKITRHLDIQTAALKVQDSVAYVLMQQTDLSAKSSLPITAQQHLPAVQNIQAASLVAQTSVTEQEVILAAVGAVHQAQAAVLSGENNVKTAVVENNEATQNNLVHQETKTIVHQINDEKQYSGSPINIADLANQLDLNGLQLIETSPDALNAVEPIVEVSAGLRRSDVPASAPIIMSSEMIQVETLR